MPACGEDLDAVAEDELQQRCGARMHRMHDHTIADSGIPLTVAPDELFKPGSRPHEPDAMHGSGDYHIKYCERLIKFRDGPGIGVAIGFSAPAR